ncbi:uncharacterized protein LOC124706110 [Lolium rigidum]|uniref:uncharacterized protein LOC124706110 n=1 Tax=Lolium rigidum TaxID=89674 RepID=UPI001F5DF221|nr:uncharacterized protein LOC124706110 [Lolium rigidum]
MANGLPTLFGHIRLLEIRGPSGSTVEDDFSAAEQSIFYGGVEIHDRHRDMRLDIENKSYELRQCHQIPSVQRTVLQPKQRYFSGLDKSSILSHSLLLLGRWVMMPCIILSQVPMCAMKAMVYLVESA